MKLIEYDDNDVNAIHMHHPIHSDIKYAEPKILHSLDSIMGQILNKKDLSDNEKWNLYNQTLQRYLHFANKSDKMNSQGNINLEAEHQFPRDSLDTITQPTVREFFKSARESIQ